MFRPAESKGRENCLCRVLSCLVLARSQFSSTRARTHGKHVPRQRAILFPTFKQGPVTMITVAAITTTPYEQKILLDRKCNGQFEIGQTEPTTDGSPQLPHKLSLVRTMHTGTKIPKTRERYSLGQYPLISMVSRANCCRTKWNLWNGKRINKSPTWPSPTIRREI